MDLSILFHYVRYDAHVFSFFFFFNDTATTEIYTLSLHDALPISSRPGSHSTIDMVPPFVSRRSRSERSEEHTSELQSLAYLVCRLLLEKKKNSQGRQPVDHPHRGNRGTGELGQQNWRQHSLRSRR